MCSYEGMRSMDSFAGRRLADSWDERAPFLSVNGRVADEEAAEPVQTTSHTAAMWFTLNALGWWPRAEPRSRPLRCFVALHRLSVFLAMVMGFYSITGFSDQSVGSNLLGCAIDFVYPLEYVCAYYQFRRKSFQRSLLRLAEYPEARHTNYYCVVYLLCGAFIAVGWAAWQKFSWWAALDHERKDSATEVGLMVAFMITFSLRLFCVIVITLAVCLVAYEHALLVRRVVRKFTLGPRDAESVRVLMREHITLQFELRAMSDSLGPVVGVFLFGTFVAAAMLLGGLLSSLITFTVFMNNASDFFLCAGLALIMLAAACTTSNAHAAIVDPIARLVRDPTKEIPNAMQLLTYVTVSQASFEAVGVQINKATLARIIYATGSIVGVIILKQQDKEG